MRAAIYAGGGGPVTIETLPDPTPAPHEVVLKIHRCGICGTDISMTKGGVWDYGKQMQFGHEYAGEIVALGRDVAGLNSGLRVGQNVTAMPSVACGQCAPCQSHGNAVLCSDKRGSAMRGFAEYAAVPASVLTPLPDTLSMADGALIEPLAISLYGAQLARIAKGDRVLVLGGGTVALYAIYWARRMSAGRIAALSRSERRRDLCLTMGADAYITAGPDEVGQVVEALGGPPKHVFECAGAEGLLMQAIRHVAPFGKVTSLGFCTTPDAIIPAMASYKCAAMQFAVGYTMAEFRYIADLLDRDAVEGVDHPDVKSLITRTAGLDDLPSVLAALRQPNTETKVHITL